MESSLLSGSCDNVSAAHRPVILAEDDNAMRVMCLECKKHETIRKDWRGVPENRQYSAFYKRDILQGNANLLYKYHSEYLRT